MKIICKDQWAIKRQKHTDAGTGYNVYKRRGTCSLQIRPNDIPEYKSHSTKVRGYIGKEKTDKKMNLNQAHVMNI